MLHFQTNSFCMTIYGLVWSSPRLVYPSIYYAPVKVKCIIKLVMRKKEKVTYLFCWLILTSFPNIPSIVSTTSKCPSLAATWKGVSPEMLVTLGLRGRSCSIVSERPHLLKQRKVYKSCQKVWVMEIIRLSVPCKKKNIISFFQHSSNLMYAQTVY